MAAGKFALRPPEISIGDEIRLPGASLLKHRDQQISIRDSTGEPMEPTLRFSLL
jgi:hypothetical protein